MTATAGLYYHPDGFDTKRATIMGRHVAGASYLAGFARHHRVDPLYAYSVSQHQAKDFEEKVKAAAGRHRPVRWVPPERMGMLAEPGCLFLPGPGVGRHAWQRRYFGQRLYSLCGLTHTLCTANTQDDFGDFLLAPVQDWDALICTTGPARQVVQRIIDDWADYLEERTGARLACPLQLPVIPLGVHCDDFAAAGPDSALRVQARAKLGAEPDDVIALFAGRLSMHSKAHPVPMFIGMDMAQARTPVKLKLMLAGRFPSADIERDFRDAAQRFAPAVQTFIIDGNDDASYAATWHAADVFVSLSDNIQETFGITTIEANAAGLPAIVSDWDGYKDTIAEGETGFRIPTYMPSSLAGEELAMRWVTDADSYDRYIGTVAQCTAVDLDAFAAAMVRLAEDPALRRRMGAAGRARARRLFDWAAVIPQYEALWGELAERRARAEQSMPVRGTAPVHPLRDDPFRAYAAFATHALTPATRFRLAVPDPARRVQALLASSMNRFGNHALLAPEEYRAVIDRLRGGEAALAALLEELPANKHPRAERTLAWLLKLGVIAVVP